MKKTWLIFAVVLCSMTFCKAQKFEVKVKDPCTGDSSICEIYLKNQSKSDQYKIGQKVSLSCFIKEKELKKCSHAKKTWDFANDFLNRHHPKKKYAILNTWGTILTIN